MKLLLWVFSSECGGNRLVLGTSRRTRCALSLCKVSNFRQRITEEGGADQASAAGKSISVIPPRAVIGADVSSVPRGYRGAYEDHSYFR
jgi:hypothetical protein